MLKTKVPAHHLSAAVPASSFKAMLISWSMKGCADGVKAAPVVPAHVEAREMRFMSIEVSRMYGCCVN
ncbi:MAG: hypothetical protein JNL43_03215 [Flavobacteriales bacterium]|nr:hypothetical protein [Flavobacteriales bacterium]